MNRITSTDKSRERIAAVGMWDGVHLGHKYLIDYLKVEASYRGLTPSVITFDRHPLNVVRPLEAPGLISTLERRLSLLEEAGVEDVILLTFNEKMRRMSARDFLKKLRKDYGVKTLLVGFNNRFGHDCKDGLEQYKAMAKDLDMEVLDAPEYKGKNSPISSSIIRKLLGEGKIPEANEKLGYEFTIRGEVTEGNQVGRTMGFPTANLKLNSEEAILPMNGVYAVKVKTPDGETRSGVVNIGFRPTIDDNAGGEVSIEVHIIDFKGYLYGEEIELQFVEYIRPEKKFNSLDKLRARIESDVKACKSIISKL